MSLFVIVSQRESMLLFVIKFKMSVHPARSASESSDIVKRLKQKLVHCSCPSQNMSVRQQISGRQQFRVLVYIYSDHNVGFGNFYILNRLLILSESVFILLNK